MPGNQIASLERNVKLLHDSSLPDNLDGLSIAHLSDIHLTGQLSIEYYRLAINWVIEQRPDLIVVAGDIVDFESCISQLELVFHQLQAPLGMYFVLGNHDRRLRQPMEICYKLRRMGWVDLGASEFRINRGGTTIHLLGNESPWFRRKIAENGAASQSDGSSIWKLGVSHSPDQLAWGIKTGCNLLLCGHTHGGQIRIPWIGPIISPSWYGSRFASGVFLKDGCLMHVSRGISSVHPVRFGCLPEVSVLKLSTLKRNN